MSKPKTLLAGWKGLTNASKWHYFDVAGRSLCGRWLTMSRAGLETGNDDSPDNCLACRRKLAALKAKTAAPLANSQPSRLHRKGATPVKTVTVPILSVDEILGMKK